MIFFLFSRSSFSAQAPVLKTMAKGILLNVLHGSNGFYMMDCIVSLSVAKHLEAPRGSITLCCYLCQAATHWKAASSASAALMQLMLKPLDGAALSRCSSSVCQWLPGIQRISYALALLHFADFFFFFIYL